MIERGGGTGQLRILHAIYVKRNLLPHEYAKLPWLTRRFIRQSVLKQIAEENRK